MNAVARLRSPLATTCVAGGALVAGATGVWLLRRFDPNAANSPFPPCLFHAFTGYYCPGCGMTRAMHALVHADVPGALVMNPLMVTLLLVSPLLLAWRFGWQPKWMSPVVSTLSRPTLWLWLLPAYWIARNLPWRPFAWMAPG